MEREAVVRFRCPNERSIQSEFPMIIFLTHNYAAWVDTWLFRVFPELGFPKMFPT